MYMTSTWLRMAASHNSVRYQVSRSLEKKILLASLRFMWPLFRDKNRPPSQYTWSIWRELTTFWRPRTRWLPPTQSGCKLPQWQCIYCFVEQCAMGIRWLCSIPVQKVLWESRCFVSSSISSQIDHEPFPSTAHIALLRVFLISSFVNPYNLYGWIKYCWKNIQTFWKRLKFAKLRRDEFLSKSKQSEKWLAHWCRY